MALFGMIWHFLVCFTITLYIHQIQYIIEVDKMPKIKGWKKVKIASDLITSIE